ncbi:hypothetical protein DVA67_001600 [Solirubrobacter sp. CPCC 204708]|uniref:Uncharacterized protein n=1 Tax=Solirubrobacter deserti TaxID=2282478 RepID=A0ABT4REB1_9ACTN|nr:hypothetical protein [Solirubrobacter deserti]MBE2314652.1 hypothetical protein [Solirubrobacter deserti]MDA0136660.1 hypothetical protein [Solirubrobacter deserti]
MVFAPLLAAPVLMWLASWVERRLGPAVGGAVAAMPFAITLIVVALGAEGPAVAESAAAHVVAQVAFAVAFARVIVRRGSLLGVAAAAVAFAAVSLLVALVPAWVAIACAVPALLAKIKVPGTSRFEGEPLDARVGAGVVTAIVGCALVVAEVSGPELAGIVAAFPTLSATFALLVARSRGVAAAASALGGLIVGLRGYLAFCVVVAVTGSVVLGLLAVAAMNVTAAWSLRLHVTSADRGRAELA